MMNGLKKEQALLEAVQSAETAAIRLRQYAAAELTGRQSATSVSGEAKDITSVEFTTAPAGDAAEARRWRSLPISRQSASGCDPAGISGSTPPKVPYLCAGL